MASGSLASVSETMGASMVPRTHGVDAVRRIRGRRRDRQLLVGGFERRRLYAGIVGAQERTIAEIRNALEKAGIEFIAENGGGAGLRLRKKEK
jgi:hypothetical protein